MGDIDRQYREARDQCLRLQTENERLWALVDELFAGYSRLCDHFAEQLSGHQMSQFRIAATHHREARGHAQADRR